jgi:hypothetical protein
MFKPLTLENLTLATTTLLKFVLLLYFLRRKLYRPYPSFFAYILATLLQTGVLAMVYHYWGFRSVQAWNTFWGSQALVICLRWLAIVEIARKVLSGYSGIWKLALRMLFFVGIGVWGYSTILSRSDWHLVVLNTDRGVELTIGVFLVVLFLFARYYRLPIPTLERYLATGFCLYSCANVVNVFLFSALRPASNELWSFLEGVAYLATLLLWIHAARRSPHPEIASIGESISPEMYAKLSLEMNTRLSLLNKRLTHLLRPEDLRS